MNDSFSTPPPDVSGVSSRRPGIFLSGFAGSWPEWLALIGGRRLRPPIAYMGSKVALIDPIFACLGLTAGMGADALVLCDGGPWGWVWSQLLVPETCRAVADVLLAWRHEDPVTLWNRLAAEPPPADLVARAATVLWLQGRTASNTPLWWEDARSRWEMQGDDSKPYAAGQVHNDGPGRWAMSEKPGHGALVSEARQRGKWSGSTSTGLRSPATVARRCDAIAEAVARFLSLQSLSVQNRPTWPDGDGWVNGRASAADGGPEPARLRSDVGARGVTGTGPIARRLDGVARADLPPLTVVHGDIGQALMLLPEDLADAVAYLDPPYLGATAYAVACSREKVVMVARDLHARGALVAISEAEPIAELTAIGWHAIDLTNARAGMRHGSRRAKPEWLTMNRPPHRRPVVQQQLTFPPARAR